MRYTANLFALIKKILLVSLLFLPLVATAAGLIQIQATNPFPASVEASSTTDAIYTVFNTSSIIPLLGIQDKSILPAGMQLLDSSTCSATVVLQPGSSCTLALRLQAPATATTLTGALQEIALPSIIGAQYPLSVMVEKKSTVAPTVTSLSPNSGRLAGGGIVSVSGTNFTGATAVYFGAVPSSDFAVKSPTLISATAPEQSAGTVDVTVQTPDGTSAKTSSDYYTYEGTPTVTGVSPPSGSPSGGTSVNITGTNFSTVRNVSFGEVAASSFTINNATSITAIAPANSAGTVDVTVKSNSGTSAKSSADEYTYEAPFGITSVTPAAGSVAGGTSVAINGGKFLGATAVRFGSTLASSFIVKNDSSIDAVSPAAVSVGVVDITVTTPSGTTTITPADKYSYVNVPTVTGVSPPSGPIAGGTSVSITGTNFSDATKVYFGTDLASFTINSPTSISVTSPTVSVAGTVDVTVESASGVVSPVSLADEYTYEAPLRITSLEPSGGTTLGGTNVTINGNKFTGATAVHFGAIPVGSFTVVDDTKITTSSPATSSTGVVDVTVTTPSGTTPIAKADEYTYVSKTPLITGIIPNSGNITGGTVVNIMGSNLTNATAVHFGDTPGVINAINSATSLTATVPTALSSGTVDITVTTPEGTSSISKGDIFTYGFPYNFITDITGNSIGNLASVLYCKTKADGSLVSCDDTNALSLLSLQPYMLAMTHINAQQIAYVTSVKGDIDKCAVNTSPRAPTFLHCDSATANLPVNFNLVKPSTSSISIATFNNNQYAYLADNEAGKIYQCQINPETANFDICNTMPSPSDWLNTAHPGPSSISFATAQGVLYAYLDDNEQGTEKPGHVWRCKIDEETGTLLSCQNIGKRDDNIEGGSQYMPDRYDWRMLAYIP